MTHALPNISSILVPALLRILDGWKVRKQLDRYVIIERPDGLALELMIIAGSKLQVSYLGVRNRGGDLVKVDSHNLPMKRFSLLRSAEDIANDIRKQLLPACEEIHPLYVERLATEDAKLLLQRDLRDELRQDLGLDETNEDSMNVSKTVNNVWVNIQINNSQSMDITLRRVNPDLARQILFSIKNMAQ
jgi:hypothetical protein